MIRYQNDGLYNMLLKRLAPLQLKYNIIPFPLVFEKLCPSFSIKKEDCFKILIFLKDSGVIDIVFGHGIRILNLKILEIKEVINHSENLTI